MQIKLGDKVRIVRHRNYFNDDLPGYENLIGEVVTVSEWYDVNDDGEAGPWRAFTSVDVSNTWMRTDDVELVLEGPVRTETVTKRRIVPGVYGRISVTARSVTRNTVGVRINANDPDFHWHDFTAEELDDLAMVASQLAEALRDA